jgi:hypothetical protein
MNMAILSGSQLLDGVHQCTPSMPPYLKVALEGIEDIRR